jgi:hypothetical protein
MMLFQKEGKPEGCLRKHPYLGHLKQKIAVSNNRRAQLG